MNELNIVNCTGFSKLDAFSNLNFSPDSVVGANCTKSWKRANKPIPGTQEFESWAKLQLSTKTNNLLGLGLFITISNPIQDSRKFPVTMTNYKVVGKSKWTEVYVVYNSTGSSYPITLLSSFPTKKEALLYAKDLTIKTHQNYSILRTRIPNNDLLVGNSVYTPSPETKEGTFIAFGYDKE